MGTCLIPRRLGVCIDIRPVLLGIVVPGSFDGPDYTVQCLFTVRNSRQVDAGLVKSLSKDGVILSD
jgi:hypothetical protein